MLATLLSATLTGLDGRPIRVEVDVAPGLPGFTIVGLADASLQEARERVRGAIRNSGFAFPPRRITVNLAPAELRKTGASLDLAIAVAVLVGSEQVRARVPWALVGELSLGGEVRPVPGLLPMVAALAAQGVPRVLVAADAVTEAGLIDGIEVVGAATLAEAADRIRGRRRSSAVGRPGRVELITMDEARERPASAPVSASVVHVPDLAEVRGQAEARRALEIALAGGHGLVFSGPPGAGKTLLARTVPGLLPPLNDAEAVEVTMIASVAGGPPLDALVRRRPFRAPHHTLSYAAMVGGGPRFAPGEVTRAHRGTLFLDELPEFDRDVLEALRQPLEDGLVALARAGRTVTFPAGFQLLAAMNPCPCGMAGDELVACRCRPAAVQRYAERVSGPLRDRIDLWVEMARVAPEEMVGTCDAESSAVVAARIAAARVLQQARNGGALNARLAGNELRDACRLGRREETRLVVLGERLRISARGMERVMRVARTVADLGARDRVGLADLAEAARYRGRADDGRRIAV